MVSFCSPPSAVSFSFGFDPLNTGRANHSRIEQRLGAAKKKKRVRRTEGRTGLRIGAQRRESGKAAFRHLALRASRHGPVAVPPVEIYYTEPQANQR
jgi:hypothetical protein